MHFWNFYDGKTISEIIYSCSWQKQTAANFIRENGSQFRMFSHIVNFRRALTLYVIQKMRERRGKEDRRAEGRGKAKEGKLLMLAHVRAHTGHTICWGVGFHWLVVLEKEEENVREKEANCLGRKAFLLRLCFFLPLSLSSFLFPGRRKTRRMHQPRAIMESAISF